MKHRIATAAVVSLVFAHIAVFADIYTPPSQEWLMKRVNEHDDLNAAAMAGESFLFGEWGFEQSDEGGEHLIRHAGITRQDIVGEYRGAVPYLGIGNPIALYNLGRLHEFSGSKEDITKAYQNYEKAFKGLDAGKKKADPRWLMNLADLYERGLGTPTNMDAAIELYRQSAEMGYARAQVALGLRYWHGKGIALDEAEAVKWFRLAASQDNLAAKCLLGQAYLFGKGVNQDKAQAIKWMQAIDIGWKAKYDRVGFDEYVATEGYLGVAYCIGDTAPKKLDIGKELLSRAERNGDRMGHHYLNVFFQSRENLVNCLVPADVESAVALFENHAAIVEQLERAKKPVRDAWSALWQASDSLLRDSGRLSESSRNAGFFDSQGNKTDAYRLSQDWVVRDAPAVKNDEGWLRGSFFFSKLTVSQMAGFVLGRSGDAVFGSPTASIVVGGSGEADSSIPKTRLLVGSPREADFSMIFQRGSVLTNMATLAQIPKLRIEILNNVIAVENIWSNINAVAALPDRRRWCHSVDPFVLFKTANSTDVSQIEELNRQVESQAKRGANILKFYQPFLALIPEWEQGRKEWLEINPVGYSSEKDFSDFPFIEQAMGAAYDAADAGAPTEYYQLVLEYVKWASVFEEKRIDAFRQCLQDIESNTVDWSGAKYGFQSCPTIKSKPQVYKKIALGMNDDCLRLLLKSESTNIVETKTEDGYHLTWKDGDRNVVLFFNKQDALWKVSIEVPGVSLGDLEAKYKKEFGVSFAMEPEDGYPKKIVEKPRVLTTPNVSLTYEPNFYEETEPVVVATEINKGYLIGTFNDGAVQVSIGPGGTVKQIGALDSGSGKSETLWTYKNGVLTTTPKGDSVCLQPPRGPSLFGLVSAHAQVAREQYGITLCEVQKEKELLDRTLESLKDSPSVIITSLEWQGFYAKAQKEKADMEAAEKAKKEQEEKQSKLDF